MNNEKALILYAKYGQDLVNLPYLCLQIYLKSRLFAAFVQNLVF